MPVFEISCPCSLFCNKIHVPEIKSIEFPNAGVSCKPDVLIHMHKENVGDIGASVNREMSDRWNHSKSE